MLIMYKLDEFIPSRGDEKDNVLGFKITRGNVKAKEYYFIYAFHEGFKTTIVYTTKSLKDARSFVKLWVE